MLDRLRQWLSSQQLTAARRRCLAWQNNAERYAARLKQADRRLQRHIRELTELQTAIDRLVEKVNSDLRVAADLYRQQATVVEDLREENRILSDTVVPTLVAGHKLILQRYDAEVAIQVRREVAAGVKDE